jgi:hypothetical protein
VGKPMHGRPLMSHNKVLPCLPSFVANVHPIEIA